MFEIEGNIEVVGLKVVGWNGVVIGLLPSVVVVVVVGFEESELLVATGVGFGVIIDVDVVVVVVVGDGILRQQMTSVGQTNGKETTRKNQQIFFCFFFVFVFSTCYSQDN